MVACVFLASAFKPRLPRRQGAPCMHGGCGRGVPPFPALTSLPPQPFAKVEASSPGVDIEGTFRTGLLPGCPSGEQVPRLLSFLAPATGSTPHAEAESHTGPGALQPGRPCLRDRSRRGFTCRGRGTSRPGGRILLLWEAFLPGAPSTPLRWRPGLGQHLFCSCTRPFLITGRWVGVCRVGARH